MTRWNTILSLTASSAVVASAAAMRPPPGPPADPAIACISNGTTSKLIVMNPDGSRATTIHSSANYMGDGPSWSPTGTSIAYVDLGSIWRIDVAVVNGVPMGSNRTLLLWNDPAAPVTHYSPVWSPMGDEIVAYNVANSGGGLISIPAGGGPPSVIYSPPSGLYATYPAWSPDGAYIAFAETDLNVGGTNSIKILDRATGLTTTVFGPQANNVQFLDWARTQNVLAFSTWAAQGRSVYTLSLTPGSTPQLIATNGMSPSWSPDDSKIIFQKTSGSGGVYSVTVTTGAVQQIAGKGSYPDRRRF